MINGLLHAQCWIYHNIKQTFAMYVSPIDDIVHVLHMQYQQCTYELMLYTVLMPPMFSDLSSIADSIDAVSTWFMENTVLLNGGKTEMIFGTCQHSASGKHRQY